MKDDVKDPLIKTFMNQPVTLFESTQTQTRSINYVFLILILPTIYVISFLNGAPQIVGIIYTFLHIFVEIYFYHFINQSQNDNQISIRRKGQDTSLEKAHVKFARKILFSKSSLFIVKKVLIGAHLLFITFLTGFIFYLNQELNENVSKESSDKETLQLWSNWIEETISSIDKLFMSIFIVIANLVCIFGILHPITSLFTHDNQDDEFIWKMNPNNQNPKEQQKDENLMLYRHRINFKNLRGAYYFTLIFSFIVFAGFYIAYYLYLYYSPRTDLNIVIAIGIFWGSQALWNFYTISRSFNNFAKIIESWKSFVYFKRTSVVFSFIHVPLPFIFFGYVLYLVLTNYTGYMYNYLPTLTALVLIDAITYGVFILMIVQSFAIFSISPVRPSKKQK